MTELLSSRLLFYNSLYSGVLLSFTSIRVLQRYSLKLPLKLSNSVPDRVGEIFDELPHIHINIEYTATVFRPQVDPSFSYDVMMMSCRLEMLCVVE